MELPSVDLELSDLGFDSDLHDFVSDVDVYEQRVYNREIVKRPQTVCYEYAMDFANQVVLDDKTETFAFVSGNFVFGDFVEALVDTRRLSVKRMSLMTLSLNDENIDSIRNTIEWENVERLDLVVSDYWFTHERFKGGLVDYLFNELRVPGMELNVAFAAVHCKTWCIETRNGHYLTIQGSANLRSSRNIEQVHISPSRDLFNFVDGFTQECINAYETVNHGNSRIKGVRSGQLWQAVAAEVAAAAVEVEADAAAAQGAAGVAVEAGSGHLETETKR